MVLSFFSNLHCDFYIVYNSSKKVRALISSMKFPSLRFILYFYKSAKQPCLEYCCHVGASMPNYYLEI